LKLYEEKTYFNCDKCKRKGEKCSGMHYAESWYCNENCLFEYIKENEAEIAEILNEDGFDDKSEINAIEDDDNENDEGDLNYDPMEDF